MKAIVINHSGGPEVMESLSLESCQPESGHVLVEVHAAGVNFMDVGVRNGALWTELPYPKTLGVEGAGRVVSVGEGVDDIQPGQRVAWVYSPGSYAEQVHILASALVVLPDDIDYRVAAAVMMQGLTASHFATEFYPVKPGDVALAHAAAGGVGLLLTQIIKLRGGQVIGRVSSEEKAAIARAAGADHVIVDVEGAFAEEAIRLSGGQGVDVVYDGGGATTFQGSLDALRIAGTFGWFGSVLGAPDAIDIASLPKSIKLGFPAFYHHVRTPELLRARAEQLFSWIRTGQLSVHIGGEYALSEAAKAHAALESRKTSGKLLLIPDALFAKGQ
jgi:NADPH2:quinone reductase